MEPSELNAPYPITNQTLRRLVVTEYYRCPDCGAGLNTALDCLECGFESPEEWSDFPGTSPRPG